MKKLKSPITDTVIFTNIKCIGDARPGETDEDCAVRGVRQPRVQWTGPSEDSSIKLHLQALTKYFVQSIQTLDAKIDRIAQSSGVDMGAIPDLPISPFGADGSLLSDEDNALSNE